MAGSNNLDRPTDLLLIENGEGGNSYVVIANPRAKTLRFFKITDGLYAAAPNLAFPLATITGPATRTLAKAANNPSLIFALDTALEEIYTVQTQTTEQAAFTHARAPFRTQSSPNDLAVFQDGSESGAWDLWVSSTYAMAADTLVLSQNAAIPLDASVTDVAFSADGTFAFVALASRENNLRVFSRTTAEQVAALSLPYLPQELKVRDHTNGELSFTEVWFRNAGGRVLGTAVFNPGDNAARYLGAAEAPAPLQTFYLPNASSENTCCDGVASEFKSPQWLSSIDAEGNMFYWQWALAGETFEALKLTLNLFDTNEEEASAEITCQNAGGESKETCGTLTFSAAPASDAPWNNWVLDGEVKWVYEGAPTDSTNAPLCTTLKATNSPQPTAHSQSVLSLFPAMKYSFTSPVMPNPVRENTHWPSKH